MFCVFCIRHCCRWFCNIVGLTTIVSLRLYIFHEIESNYSYELPIVSRILFGNCVDTNTLYLMLWWKRGSVHKQRTQTNTLFAVGQPDMLLTKLLFMSNSTIPRQLLNQCLKLLFSKFHACFFLILRQKHMSQPHRVILIFWST